MNWYDLHKKHMEISGATPREVNLKHKQFDFNEYFKNTLTRETVELLTHSLSILTTELAFVDHSQSNNKDLSDDKYIVGENLVSIDVGDYVRWRNSIWMIFTKEYKTIDTHQQAKIKNANELIKWIRNGKIVNNGKGFYAYAQNQTLYTMGISETMHLHIPDGKMMMYMQSNVFTRDIRLNERLVIGGKIYQVKNIDSVSRPGLLSFLLDQDRIDSIYDNLELGVADYYRYYNKEDDFTSEDGAVIPEILNTISGNQSPKIGSIQTYTSTEKVIEWNIESVLDRNSFIVMSQNENQITIQFKEDFRFIGDTISIVARNEDDKYAVLPLTINKKY